VSEFTPTDQHTLVRRGFRLVAVFVRAHPLVFSIAVAGSVLFAMATVASTVVLGWVTDDVIIPVFGDDPDDGSGRSRAFVLGAVIVVGLAKSTGVVTRRFFAGMTQARVLSDLQRALGRHYLAMAPEQLRVEAKGRLLAHVDSDSDVAADALSPLPFAIGVVTLIAVAIGSLAFVDPWLMAVAVAMAPLIAWLNHAKAKASESPAVEVRESVARMTSVASESFDGALVVKTLGRESEELDRFGTASARLRDDSVRLGRIRALYSAVGDLIPDVGVVALVTIGAWRVSGGHITTGQLVQAVSLFGVLVFPLRVIGFFIGDLPPAVVAHDRVAARLAGSVRRRSGTAALTDGALGVELRGVAVRHAGAGAATLDGIDLMVEPGETLAVVGSTGAGKSTLLAAMADMVPLESGSVFIGGHDVAGVAGASLVARVAMGWQQPFLLDGTVAENIAFGGDHSEAEIRTAARTAQIAAVIDDLPRGYDTTIGEGGVRLSGGQRQRLALARALVRRPGLLLLDDATSAVDPVVEQAILDQIRTLDTTVVVVAHRRSTVLLADRVALLAEGRIVATGTHDELMAIPAYAALLEAYERGAVT
jgi:ATP-binding cassette, subfamily B, bacterial